MKDSTYNFGTKNKDCTILVNSCDLYEDAWEPFFKLFKIQWPDCPYSFILNTESKNYKSDFWDITIFKSGDIPWSDRVLNALETIESEFVVFFLEDFFLMSPVNVDVFHSALSLIRENEKIGAICFNPDIDSKVWKTKGEYDKYFTELKKGSIARINAVAALWRKDFLTKMLKRGENPWEFESNGTKRGELCEEIVLCLTDVKYAPFRFHFCVGYGYGITSKSWLPKNKELFDKYDIKVDFENLGWYVPQPKRQKRSFKEKISLIYKNPKELFEMFSVKIKHFFKI